MNMQDLLPIFTKDGRINTAIVKQEKFFISEIYKKIVESTQFLSVSASLSERVYCIKNLITSQPLCPICKKNVLRYTFYLNKGYTATCGSKECYVKTDKRSLMGNKISKTKNKNVKEKIQTFYESYENNDFIDMVREDILCFYNEHVSFIKERGIQYFHFEKHKDILCSVIKQTSFLQLDKSNPKFNERFFLILNNMLSLPICECGDKKNFQNLNSGYVCSKPTCYSKKIIEVKFINKIKNIEPVILAQGFEFADKVNLCLLNYGPIKLRHMKCGQVKDYQLFNGGWQRLYCKHCHQNREEQSVYEFLLVFLKENQIIKQFNKFDGQKRLDFYIPEKKIAIEYDGIYWHSNIDKNYHLDRTLKCQEQGIKLYHIFSNEWMLESKRYIWQSLLRNKFNQNNIKIGARECEIKEVSKIDKNLFLNFNHLQGEDNSSIALGLYHDGCLVSLATFSKPRFSKKYDYELVRFCNKQDLIISGGFSRLLNYFEKTYKPKSLVTYSDLRYSDGNLYQNNGFKFVKRSNPNYFYWKDILHLKSRMQFQKHKLAKLLENFDPNLSEAENMKKHDWNIIYDCGNLVFEKII